MAGKGDKNRTKDFKKFRDNYDMAFNNEYRKYQYSKEEIERQEKIKRADDHNYDLLCRTKYLDCPDCKCKAKRFGVSYKTIINGTKNLLYYCNTCKSIFAAPVLIEIKSLTYNMG